MDIKKITYALIPFSVALLFMGIFYFGNQWYAETFGNPGVDYSYIFYGFNIKVPFLSWTIYPYIIAYPFWIFTFFYIAYNSKKAAYTILTIFLILLVICGVWYFFFQSDVEAWRVTSGLFVNDVYLAARPDLNFTERLVVSIYEAAGPRNALPSLHTVQSWGAIIALRMIKKSRLLPKIIIWTIGLSIIISTQTLKQHYIIDVIVALALTEAFYWIVKDTKLVTWVENFFTNINLKLGIEKK